jgi:hypothetical protein
MMTYEQTNGAVGTTSFGEYLPIWVKHPPRGSPLEPMYRRNEPIDRLARDYLPPNATVETSHYGFNQAEVVIDSPEPYWAIFNTFYFPGWQARIDGQVTQITPFSERGLISINVPEGRRRLHLAFTETPLRRVANAISGASLITIIVLFTVASFRQKTANLTSPIPHPPSHIPYPTSHRPHTCTVQKDRRKCPTPTFNRQHLSLLAGLALFLIAGKMLYLDRADTLLKHQFDGVRVHRAGVSTQVNFGEQVNLLGYTLDRHTAASGQIFNLTAYWQGQEPLTTDYSALAHLVDAEGHLYAGQDNLHPGSLRSSQWEPWGFVQDTHAVPAPPGTPPGDYFLAIGLYNPDTWARLPVVSGGAPGWPDVLPVPVRLIRPVHPPTLAELDIEWPVDATFGRNIRLLGATPERNALARNDFLRLAIFWEAVAAPITDYQVHLRLLDSQGSVAVQTAGRPSHNRYPTPYWHAGERVRDDHSIWIPTDFPAGIYRLQVRLLDESSQPVGAWLELGVMETSAQ